MSSIKFIRSSGNSYYVDRLKHFVISGVPDRKKTSASQKLFVMEGNYSKNEAATVLACMNMASNLNLHAPNTASLMIDVEGDLIGDMNGDSIQLHNVVIKTCDLSLEPVQVVEVPVNREQLLRCPVSFLENAPGWSQEGGNLNDLAVAPWSNTTQGEAICYYPYANSQAIRRRMSTAQCTVNSDRMSFTCVNK